MIRTTFTVMILALLLGNCSSSNPEIFPSSLDASTTRSNYHLMPGDEVSINFDQQKELSGNYVIDPAGDIFLPTLGSINLDSLTISQANRQVELAFRKHYLAGKPHLKVLSYQSNEQITIIGEVNQPGNFKIKNELTLIKAIGLAGGFNPHADLSRIRIVRNREGGRTTKINFEKLLARGDYEQDLILYSNDLVFVPEKRMIGLFAWASKYQTLLQALILTLVAVNQLGA